MEADERTMKALIFDPTTRHGLRFGDVAEPKPVPTQALVEVHAVSLNWGELKFLGHMHQPGDVPGWDAAGIVVRAAADGAGPRPGTRVVTAGWNGAWGELRAVETNELAALPAEMDFGAASALPAAGVTALRAIRSLGAVVGRRVLVTGASGGVGSFAVQLLRCAGAHVVASVSGEGRGEALRKLGAREVVVGLGGVSEPFHGVLDNVGGSVLTRAFGLVAPGGTLVSIGNASLEPSTLDFEQERSRGGDRRIVLFTVGPTMGADLSCLVDRVSSGEITPQIGWRGGWRQAVEAADALLGRRVRGKVVLDVRGEGG
jgi:NADPH:quinone reductase-like Zn-dependent oxidoreductase